MNLKNDYEPRDERVFENDLRFKREVPESKQFFKYHPNLDIHYFKQVDTKKKAYCPRMCETSVLSRRFSVLRSAYGSD